MKPPLLLLLLRALSLPREHIVIYAWHPLPIWEFVCQGHIDAAVTTALALAVLLTVRQRQGLAGVLLGIAALIKYFPVVLVPALWRRWDWRMPLAFVATAVVLYLPYIREAGGRVLGYLGNHLDNEGYAAGWGFHPIWLLRDFSIADPPAKAYVVVAIGLLALLGARVLFRSGASKVQLAALPLLGAAFVWLVSPHYPWYFAFLPALLVASPSAPVLLMSVLAVALYWPRPPGGITWTEIYLLVYWLPLALLAATAGWRLMRRA